MAEGSPVKDYGLGTTLKARYEIRAAIPVVFLGLTIFWGLVGLGLIIGGLRGRASDPSLVCLSVAGLLPLGVAIWAFFQWRRRRGMRVLVFKDGLVHIKGGREEVFRWDDIESVWASLTKTRPGSRAVYHYYTIRRTDGRKVVFSGDLPGVAALGKTIVEEVKRHQLPRAIEAFKNGETIWFGSLGVGRDGLSNRKETIPWDQVEEVKMERGVIAVRKEGQWLRWAGVTVGGTPNVYVFLDLVDHVIGVTRGSATRPAF
jgi:hypothetical protein